MISTLRCLLIINGDIVEMTYFRIKYPNSALPRKKIVQYCSKRLKQSSFRIARQSRVRREAGLGTSEERGKKKFIVASQLACTTFFFVCVGVRQFE